MAPRALLLLATLAAAAVVAAPRPTTTAQPKPGPVPTAERSAQRELAARAVQALPRLAILAWPAVGAIAGGVIRGRVDDLLTPAAFKAVVWTESMLAKGVWSYGATSPLSADGSFSLTLPANLKPEDFSSAKVAVMPQQSAVRESECAAAAAVAAVGWSRRAARGVAVGRVRSTA